MFLILLAARKDGTRPLKFNQYGNRRINKNSRVRFLDCHRRGIHEWERITLSKHSPAGQDFSISTGPFESAEELINSIHQRYVEFDADSETYLWLDNEGHGKNGAPYRMRDVLEDMEACEKMIYDLFICYRDAYEKK